jgi:hypothetical protein
VASDAEIDAKLARIGNRVASVNADTAATVRAELAAIGCLELAEACKSRFGARLAYLRTPRVELGHDPGPGCVWTVYTPPKVRK